MIKHNFSNISKEEYLKECDGSLKICFQGSVGSGNPAKPDFEDVFMMGMSKKDSEEIVVSYTKLRDQYLFFRGFPLTCSLVDFS